MGNHIWLICYRFLHTCLVAVVCLPCCLIILYHIMSNNFLYIAKICLRNSSLQFLKAHNVGFAVSGSSQSVTVVVAGAYLSSLQLLAVHSIFLKFLAVHCTSIYLCYRPLAAHSDFVACNYLTAHCIPVCLLSGYTHHQPCA